MSRRRRVLVIAYDFPPHGAIGTMRTLRLVQRLAEDDWDVKVLTSDPRTFRSGTPLDNGLLTRVPPAVTVLRAPVIRGFDALKNLVRRPTRHGRTAHDSAAVRPTKGSTLPRSLRNRASDLVDAALAIPDHESGWLLPAVVRGLWTCGAWRPDVLYSSAPPWTGQLVALQLATVLRCPWVADFRDPWARAPWREGRLEFVKRANSRLERAVIHKATAVLFVTRGNLTEFSAFYGREVGGRFHLVPNGCDPSEFKDIVSVPEPGRFVLLHAGALYGARNPLPLIRAIARAIDRGALVRDSFRLRLLGPINLSMDLAAEISRMGLEGVVELVPRVTRAESLREMVSASALLLVQPGTTVSVPGKAYEYLAAGRPVLALAEEGETADLVRASGVGVSVRSDAAVETIEAALFGLMAIATPGSYVLPSRSLYDGTVHAATAARLLAQLAQSGGRGRSMGVIEPRHPAGAALQPEEPRQ